MEGFVAHNLWAVGQHGVSPACHKVPSKRAAYSWANMAVCAGAEQVGGLSPPLPRKEQLLGVQVIVLQSSHNTRNDASTSAPSAPLLGAGSKSLVLRACVNHGTPFNAGILQQFLWHFQAPQLGQGVDVLRSPLDYVLAIDASYLHAGQEQCFDCQHSLSEAAGFSRNIVNFAKIARLSTHLELVEPWLVRWSLWHEANRQDKLTTWHTDSVQRRKCKRGTAPSCCSAAIMQHQHHSGARAVSCNSA